MSSWTLLSRIAESKSSLRPTNRRFHRLVNLPISSGKCVIPVLRLKSSEVSDVSSPILLGTCFKLLPLRMSLSRKAHFSTPFRDSFLILLSASTSSFSCCVDQEIGGGMSSILLLERSRTFKLGRARRKRGTENWFFSDFDSPRLLLFSRTVFKFVKEEAIFSGNEVRQLFEATSASKEKNSCKNWAGISVRLLFDRSNVLSLHIFKGKSGRFLMSFPTRYRWVRAGKQFPNHFGRQLHSLCDKFKLSSHTVYSQFSSGFSFGGCDTKFILLCDRFKTLTFGPSAFSTRQ